MLHAAGYEVYARRFDARMPQYIREPCDVTAGSVKHFREKMAQVVREYFGWRYARFSAYGLHLGPYLLAADALTASGQKNLAGGGFVFCGILEQLAAKLAGD